MDCNDNDMSINPGAAEIPDNMVDENCDGFNNVTCQFDGDHDGFGISTTVISTTDVCQPELGEALDANDCDDSNANIFPGATEICDGFDNNCNDMVDDNPQPALCANQIDICAGSFASTCGGAAGWAQCTDVDYSNNNAAYQIDETVCDGLDNDCDGFVDEGCPADTDNDRMPDDWETRYGLIVGVDDSQGDLDGDGTTNLQEFQEGTDPTRAGALPPAYELPLHSAPAINVPEDGPVDGQRPLPVDASLLGSQPN